MQSKKVFFTKSMDVPLKDSLSNNNYHNFKNDFSHRHPEGNFIISEFDEKLIRDNVYLNNQLRFKLEFPAELVIPHKFDTKFNTIELPVKAISEEYLLIESKDGNFVLQDLENQSIFHILDGDGGFICQSVS